VSISAAREKFRSFLTQKGLRVTSQRLAIFEAAFAQPEHFTAEQLVDFARAIDDSVSRATIYRTLALYSAHQNGAACAHKNGASIFTHISGAFCLKTPSRL
jgi:Fe2+ or Zn2+ uptake regulation protein